MGLTTETIIDWNGKQQPASEVIFGQPNRANQAQQKAQTNQPQTGTGDILKATMGGIYSNRGGLFEEGDVDIAAMKKLLKDGYAFVIKYGNGGFNVVTPRNHKFTPQDIRQLEAKMGITPKTPVQWFVNSVSANAMQDTTAEVAIYGAAPSGRRQPNLATPPPEL